MSCPAGGAYWAHTSSDRPSERLVGELWGFANCSLGRAWRWSLFLVPYHQRCFIERTMLRGFLLWLAAEWFLQCNIGLEDLRSTCSFVSFLVLTLKQWDFFLFHVHLYAQGSVLPAVTHDLMSPPLKPSENS